MSSRTVGATQRERILVGMMVAFAEVAAVEMAGTCIYSGGSNGRIC